MGEYIAGQDKTEGQRETLWEQIDLTIDSGAVDTVIPPKTVPTVPLRETQAPPENVYYLAANKSMLAGEGNHAWGTRAREAH